MVYATLRLNYNVKKHRCTQGGCRGYKRTNPMDISKTMLHLDFQLNQRIIVSNCCIWYFFDISKSGTVGFKIIGRNSYLKSCLSTCVPGVCAAPVRLLSKWPCGQGIWLILILLSPRILNNFQQQEKRNSWKSKRDLTDNKMLNLLLNSKVKFFDYRNIFNNFRNVNMVSFIASFKRSDLITQIQQIPTNPNESLFQ